MLFSFASEKNVALLCSSIRDKPDQRVYAPLRERAADKRVRLQIVIIQTKTVAKRTSLPEYGKIQGLYPLVMVG